MNELLDRFDQPLPSWIADIKKEAHRKIAGANFAAACRSGDVTAMRNLILGVWPFVDIFPKIIIRGSRCLYQRKSFRDRELLNMLIHRGSRVLSSIQQDEEDHRTLWLNAGSALKANYPIDFDREPIPEVRDWIDAVSQTADPFTMFLRFAAIEIIAESVSVDFLSSVSFTTALGTRGCEWFRVHAVHDTDLRHEELELRLGFAFRGQPTKKESNTVIQGVIDLFLMAARACCELT